MSYNKIWISKRNQERMGLPVGDPFAGPAFGQKNDIGTALTVGGGIVSGYMASSAAEDAAKDASRAQIASSQNSVAEQQRQFEELKKLLAPYSTAGTQSLTQQSALVGLSGNAAQQAAIDNIKSSSEFTELKRQGEAAILQNASATGGLRGGNVQGALSQFSPQLLNQLIQQRYTNLGGITSLGQNSAAFAGNAGMRSAESISNQYAQQGAATAGALLAGGNAQSQLWNSIGQGLGTIGAKF